MTTISSTDPTSPTLPGDALNELEYTYDNQWELDTFTQRPMLSVTSGPVGTVDYDFSASVATGSVSTTNNHYRLSQLKYPLTVGSNRTVVTSDYGSSANDLDDRITRTTGLSWAGGSHTLTQEYLGLGLPVICQTPAQNIQLNRQIDSTMNVTTTDTFAGKYYGLDQFGRIGRQVWAEIDDGTTPTPNSWDPDTHPAFYDLGYTYDQVSNITARIDKRPLPNNGDRDDSYVYDALHRLTLAFRGVVASGSIASTSAKKLSQEWGYDILGNWPSFYEEIDGTRSASAAPASYTGTGETQTRTHNDANEIASMTVAGTTSTFVNDPNGNLTSQVRTGVGSSAFAGTWTYDYDAWNRLTRVWVTPSGGSAQSRARYTYYGLNQRASGLVDTDQDAQFTPDEFTAYFYDSSWRLLERRKDTAYTGNWAATTTFARDKTIQHIWGLNYIDELIAQQTELNGQAGPSGIFAQPVYALRDRNYSVIGRVGSAERVRYTSYGEPVASPAADLNGDGSVTTTDQTTLLGAFGKSMGQAGYVVEADINRDGSVTTTDLTKLLGQFGNTLGRGTLSADPDWITAYDGYLYEPETGLYCVRNRWYEPNAGRWTSRDPAEYAESGSNLYSYCSNGPQSRLDPSGLSEIDDGSISIPGGDCRKWRVTQGFTKKRGLGNVDVSAGLSVSGIVRECKVCCQDGSEGATFDVDVFLSVGLEVGFASWRLQSQGYVRGLFTWKIDVWAGIRIFGGGRMTAQGKGSFNSCDLSGSLRTEAHAAFYFGVEGGFSGGLKAKSRRRIFGWRPAIDVGLTGTITGRATFTAHPMIYCNYRGCLLDTGDIFGQFDLFAEFSVRVFRTSFARRWDLGGIPPVSFGSHRFFFGNPFTRGRP